MLLSRQVSLYSCKESGHFHVDISHGLLKHFTYRFPSRYYSLPFGEYPCNDLGIIIWNGFSGIKFPAPQNRDKVDEIIIKFSMEGDR